MTESALRAALLFPPSPAGDTAVADAVTAALTARGLEVRPLRHEDAGPDIILDATAGPMPGRDDVPVLRLSLARGEDAASGSDGRGIHPALPAIGGCIIGRAATVTASGGPDPDRIAFIAELARNWARLHRAAPAERRLVLVPAGDDGEFQATIAMLRALQASGHRVADIPANGEALAARLRAGPTDAAPDRFTDETFARSDYGAWFATLPRAVQDAVAARWGPPERDPFFREGELDCGSFALSALRCGSVIVALPPGPGAADAAPAPRHGYLAFQAWIADGVRAHAVVLMGEGAGRQGVAMGLAAGRVPGVTLGPLPYLYPTRIDAR